MGVNLVYERANKDAYTILQSGNLMQSGDELSSVISNTVFPTILNKIGDTITRSDLVDRNYSKFKRPLTEFGAITEYLAANMIRADSPTNTDTGTQVSDFVVNNPDIKAVYATKLVRANYPLTINSERWLDCLDNRDIRGLSSAIAIAMQSLYDGVTHDHDSFIPALFGSLYNVASAIATTQRIIPKYTGDKVEEYSKEIFSVINKGIRDMTQWRRNDFNIMKMDMSDSKSDLVLVAFDNPVGANDTTSLDVITGQLSIGPMARAEALGKALGVDVYEMPSPGILTNDVARAYSLSNFPGMQTVTEFGTRTIPYPNIKYALVGKGALNVGLKRLQNDTGRSVRGHFDQTWVQPTLQLAYGAGQVIFFSEAEDAGGEG